MRKLVFLLTILLITAGYSFAQKKNRPVRRVKGYSKVVIGRSANTLWRSSKVEVNGNVRYYHYLRFYPDGTVIGVSSSGKPTDLKRWFNKPYDDTGTYSIVRTKINFSLTSSEGTVDYEGSIARRVLTLDEYSHINDNRSVTTYAPVRKASKRKKLSRSR